MKAKEHVARLSDIIPQIYRADYYPFRSSERVGPRRTLAHSFLYMYEGSGLLTIGGTPYACTRDDLFYIPAGIVHSFQADAPHPMVHASIYFDWITDNPHKGDLSLFRFGDQPCPLAECSPGIRFTDCPQIPVKSQASRHTKWMGAYLEVIEDIEKTQQEAGLLRRALFEQFVAGMIASSGKPSTPIRDPRIQTIVRQMKSMPQQQVTVQEWAARSGLSTSYFHRLFLEETGMSPNAYANNCKLVYARKLMRETNHSISSITEELGFGSLHYFSRLFSKHFGESPSTYRRRIREIYSEQEI